MSEEKKKLLSKAFFTEYGVSKTEKLLKGWEAVPLENDVYRVTRLDSTKVDIKIGQELPNIGAVKVNDEGNIEIGKYTVLVGKGLISGMTAKKTRKKDEYLFLRENKRAIKALLGDNINGIGEIKGPDEFGNVVIGDGSVPVAKKIKELKLLIYNERHDDFKTGYKCHFNVIEPGVNGSYENGIPGVFFPAKGNGPAKFCEIGDDGKTLQTAVFWPSKNKLFSVGRMRTIDMARQEKAVLEQVQAASNEAKEFGIEPEEHFEYVAAKEALTECNNQEWESQQFTVVSGKNLFGLVEAEKTAGYVR